MNDLNQRLNRLIKDKLAEPVNFKVAQGQDGRLSIEQVQFLRTEDLAALINLEPRTIRGWVSKRLVPFYKPPGSSLILFDLNEVIASIKQNKVLDEAPYES